MPKQRFKVASFKMADGDVRHFKLVGGRWLYCGRKNLNLSRGVMSNGIWKEWLPDEIHGHSFKTMVEISTHFNNGIKPKLSVAIREWDAEEEPVQ